MIQLDALSLQSREYGGNSVYMERGEGSEPYRARGVSK